MKPLVYHFAQVSSAGLPNNGSKDPTAGAVGVALNIVFGVTASIAILMIVIAGFRYIIAKGDPQDMATARNTIIYSLVGLLITVAAYGLVTFVLKGLG